MANQVIPFSSILISTSTALFMAQSNIDDVAINPDFIEGGITAYPVRIFLEFGNNRITVRLDSTPGGGGASAGPDFTTDFEQNGTITIATGDYSFTFSIEDDFTEPYVFIVEGQVLTDLEAFVVAVAALASPVSGTLTFDDGEGTTPEPPSNVPPSVVIHTAAETVDGGDDVDLDATVEDSDGTIASTIWTGAGTFGDPSAVDTDWTAPAAQATQRTYVLRLTAEDDDGATTYAEVTMTVRAVVVPPDPMTPTLTLADDLDLTGLESEMAAVFSRGGTTDTLWAEPPRGTVGSLTEGEVGLGAGETRISRIQVTAGNQIRLNDNDNPVALSPNDYFNGDGNDLTCYIITPTDTYSFSVAGNIAAAGGGFIRFFVGTAAHDALQSLPNGHPFILAFARAATVPPTPNVEPEVTIQTSARTVDGGDVVSLDATVSDPDGSIAATIWTGPGTFDDDGSVDTDWTAPAAQDTEQEYVLRLTATDDDGASAFAEVVITVAAAVAVVLPTATINTPNTTVDGGADLELDATVTGAQVLRWTATFGTFDDEEAEDATWTAPGSLLNNQDYVLRLTVTSEDELEAYAEVTITVRGLADEPAHHEARLVRWTDDGISTLTADDFTALRTAGYDRYHCHRIHGGAGVGVDSGGLATLPVAQEEGYGIAGYIYVNRGAGRDEVVEAVEALGDLWEELSWVGIDVERNTLATLPSVEDVQNVVDAVIEFRQRPVIYTNRSTWVAAPFSNTTDFSHLPLWCASWVEDAGTQGTQPTNLDISPSAFGGWVSPTIARQYAGEIDHTGVSGDVDSNISLDTLWGDAPGPVPAFTAYGNWERRSGHKYGTMRLGTQQHLISAQDVAVRTDMELSVFDASDLNAGQSAVYGTGPIVNDDPVPAAILTAGNLHEPETYTRPLQRQYIVAAATGGSFTLRHGQFGIETADIDHDASASDIENALEAIDEIIAVSVTGAGTFLDPWYVIFERTDYDSYVLMSSDDTNLTGDDETLYVYAERYGERPVEFAPASARAGEAGFRMFIKGRDVTRNVKDRSIRIIDEINPVGDTLNFTLEDIYRPQSGEVEPADEPGYEEDNRANTDSVRPIPETLCTLWFEGLREFEGPIVAVREHWNVDGYLSWDITVSGYWHWLDSQMLRDENIPRQSATDTIYSIVNKYAPDFSVLGVYGINPTTLTPEVQPPNTEVDYKLPSVASKEWDFIRPTQAINQLRREAEFHWFIGYDRTLYTYREGENIGQAPIGILYVDNIQLRPGVFAGSQVNLQNYIIDNSIWDFELTEDVRQLKTVVYMRDYEVPSEEQIPIVINAGSIERTLSLPREIAGIDEDTFVVEIRAPADGEEPPLSSAERTALETRISDAGWNREIVAGTPATADAAATPTTGASNSRNIYAFHDDIASIIGDGLTSEEIIKAERGDDAYEDGDRVFLVSKGQRLIRTADGDVPIPNGARVVFHTPVAETENNEFADPAAVRRYAALESDTGTLPTSARPSIPPRSGRHEAVENRSGRTYNSRSDIAEEAHSILDLYKDPLLKGSFKTWTAGWRPGQFFLINSRGRSSSSGRGYALERMFVTGVTKHIVKITPGQVQGIRGGSILESIVTFSNKSIIG